MANDFLLEIIMRNHENVRDAVFLNVSTKLHEENSDLFSKNNSKLMVATHIHGLTGGI